MRPGWEWETLAAITVGLLAIATLTLAALGITYITP